MISEGFSSLNDSVILYVVSTFGSSLGYVCLEPRGLKTSAVNRLGDGGGR